MLLGILFSLFFTFTAVEDSFSLEKLKWQNNIVLYFPVDNTEARITIDKDLDDQISKMDVVYFIFGDKTISNSSYELSEADIKNIKTKYLLGAKNDCWVLLGKNGKIKYRTEKTTDWQTILNKINLNNDEKIALKSGI